MTDQAASVRSRYTRPLIEWSGLMRAERRSNRCVFATVPPDMGTSMLFDREKGLQLEWHARNGVIRDLGVRHGIPTPVSDVIVPLLAAASEPA